MKMTDKTFLAVILVLVMGAMAATAYHFLIRGAYEVVLELPCDPELNTCFSRDCSTGECPDNGLELYRIFALSARDFQQCADTSCLDACTEASIECTEYACGESEEDACAP